MKGYVGKGADASKRKLTTAKGSRPRGARTEVRPQPKVVPDTHGGYHEAISARAVLSRRSGTPLPSGRVVAATIAALFGLSFLLVWLAR